MPGIDDDQTPQYAGHLATLDDVRAGLVDSFSGSASRPVLFAEVCRLVTAVTDRIPMGAVFNLSGHFVADIENPDNFYLGVIVHRDNFAKLSNQDRWILQVLLQDDRTFSGESFTASADMALVVPNSHIHYREMRHQMALVYGRANAPTGDELGGHIELDIQGILDVEQILQTTTGSGKELA